MRLFCFLSSWAPPPKIRRYPLLYGGLDLHTFRWKNPTPHCDSYSPLLREIRRFDDLWSCHLDEHLDWAGLETVWAPNGIEIPSFWVSTVHLWPPEVCLGHMHFAFSQSFPVRALFVFHEPLSSRFTIVARANGERAEKDIFRDCLSGESLRDARNKEKMETDILATSICGAMIIYRNSKPMFQGLSIFPFTTQPCNHSPLLTSTIGSNEAQLTLFKMNLQAIPHTIPIRRVVSLRMVLLKNCKSRYLDFLSSHRPTKFTLNNNRENQSSAKHNQRSFLVSRKTLVLLDITSDSCNKVKMLIPVIIEVLTGGIYTVTAGPWSAYRIEVVNVDNMKPANGLRLWQDSAYAKMDEERREHRTRYACVFDYLNIFRATIRVFTRVEGVLLDNIFKSMEGKVLGLGKVLPISSEGILRASGGCSSGKTCYRKTQHSDAYPGVYENKSIFRWIFLYLLYQTKPSLEVTYKTRTKLPSNIINTSSSKVATKTSL
ncbi:uncharacterized protein BDR25DRAFT_360147 [Lindgomyces ingoldianus]|uniref:Uncharacterized protein n=1 Tax=Lindgomyces ingoldianus TaxID=673940 RepID=A0ACB6QGI1_9PLEO|nr:uncharacterized protein BDR25DRAFT_360147 [Lindgomyces ingoldianus]KAF2465992.1 hypothetical protein BDR25DRAFT_360147 [Lindgomyces ingoldianus]